MGPDGLNVDRDFHLTSDSPEKLLEAKIKAIEPRLCRVVGELFASRGRASINFDHVEVESPADADEAQGAGDQQRVPVPAFHLQTLKQDLGPPLRIEPLRRLQLCVPPSAA